MPAVHDKYNILSYYINYLKIVKGGWVIGDIYNNSTTLKKKTITK